MNCDSCGGVYDWCDDLGYVCVGCGRTPLITRQATPELAQEAKACNRAYSGLDLYADFTKRRRRVIQ